jgi:DNA adenine methylase
MKPNDTKRSRVRSKTPATVKPFLKWAGGKAQILEKIRMQYPVGLGTTVTKYAEPFVGGGAVLFDILNKYNIGEVYIGDTNHELILTYITVRDNIDGLIKALRDLEKAYLPADETRRKELYYACRARFNALKAANDESVELAALFIFLNRTCFNGLYRVNAKGEFNVPQGSYKNPCICDEDNLRAVSLKLQNVKIVCGDYKESRTFIGKDTFVYFDPPYRPLNASSSFTSYTQDGFNDGDQIELARFIDKISESGAFVIASNSDPKNANEADDFFDKLYSRHKIFRICAGRAINSVGNNRGKINELLIASY